MFLQHFTYCTKCFPNLTFKNISRKGEIWTVSFYYWIYAYIATVVLFPYIFLKREARWWLSRVAFWITIVLLKYSIVYGRLVILLWLKYTFLHWTVHIARLSNAAAGVWDCWMANWLLLSTCVWIFLAEFFTYINYFQLRTVKTAWGEDLLYCRRRIRGGEWCKPVVESNRNFCLHNV